MSGKFRACRINARVIRVDSADLASVLEPVVPGEQSVGTWANSPSTRPTRPTGSSNFPDAPTLWVFAEEFPVAYKHRGRA